MAASSSLSAATGTASLADVSIPVRSDGGQAVHRSAPAWPVTTPRTSVTAHTMRASAAGVREAGARLTRRNSASQTGTAGGARELPYAHASLPT